MDDNTKDDYFGVCPTCEQNDGYLNIGRDHFFICHAHRVKWCVGESLFSSWRSETEEHWARNYQILALYQDVEPLFIEQSSATESTTHCNSFDCDTEKKKRQEACSGCSEHVPATIRRAIVEVIEYVWDEELSHFLEHGSKHTATDINGHVFQTLCKLRTFFEGREHDPRFYLAKAAHPAPITSKTRFVIDRVRGAVFDAQSQAYEGEILGTTVGKLRDESGNAIGLEVIHSCEAKDGKEFWIDASVWY